MSLITACIPNVTRIEQFLTFLVDNVAVGTYEFVCTLTAEEGRTS